jgi:DNA-binding LytR/AlgR family response regulator
MIAMKHDVNYSQPKPIIVKDKKLKRIITPSDIVYITAKSNYSLLKLVDGGQIFTSKTLKYWVNTIGPNPGFLRVHRGTLVNNDHVREFLPKKRVFIVTGNHELSISRRSLKCISS